MRLAEDRFYNKFPCIIITGKGQPDVATRMFLRRLKVLMHGVASVRKGEGKYQLIHALNVCVSAVSFDLYTNRLHSTSRYWLLWTPILMGSRS